MARLNITVPDDLYARLEQFRDRINISKVCAIALEKEATMLKRQPSIADPRLAQLLHRLQSTRERWYQRGREDGTQWALELATRRELRTVATELADWNGIELVEDAHPERWSMEDRGRLRQQKFPTNSFQTGHYLKQWSERDHQSGKEHWSDGGQAPSGEIDEAAYLEGWRDAIKEIWNAISPALE